MAKVAQVIAAPEKLNVKMNSTRYESIILNMISKFMTLLWQVRLKKLDPTNW